MTDRAVLARIDRLLAELVALRGELAGVQPTAEAEADDDAVRSWVRSRMIAYAKAQRGAA